MTSAANRAAKALMGASRNRPSRSMSQPSGLSSSLTSGGGGSTGGGGERENSSSSNTTDDAPPPPPHNDESRRRGGGGGGPPGFMRDLQSQYESLSERLAREVASSSAMSSSGRNKGVGGRRGKSPNSKGGGKQHGESRRVRWAETARIASTMDRADGGGGGGGGDYDENDDDAMMMMPPRSTAEIIGDLFTRKYTLPIFLLMTTGIFLLVHLAGGPNDDSLSRYSSSSSSSQQQQQSSPGMIPGGATRSGSLEDVLFSFTPNAVSIESLSPTMLAISHTTPKISPITAGSSPGSSSSIGGSAEGVGNEPGWIIVETASGVIGGVAVSDAVELGDEGGKAGLKWGYGIGVPTPDPALLLSAKDDGSPTTLKWGYAPGVPTPDPATLAGVDQGAQAALVWNYPPGVPTPNPALLVEIAPPAASTPEDGSPTTLKWGGMNGLDKDVGNPTTLKWNYPPGVPTPDPALLKGVPDQLVWGYPPGVPTPDPILLEDAGEAVALVWGYPPGVPTPDPALLAAGGEETVGWGYPPGEPTPDPALLNGGTVGGTESPTKRNVETGMSPPSKKPTKKAGLPVTMKIQDMTPETARPGIPEDAYPPGESPPGDGGPNAPRPPTAPLIPVDHNGNPVEVAPAPKGPRPAGSGGQRPKVNLHPYNGPGGFHVVGSNPDFSDPDYNGPNGYTIDQIGFNGGMVIPQMQSSCGCCCCNCGGGSVVGIAERGMVVPLTSQGYAQHMTRSGGIQGMLDGSGQLVSVFPGSMASSETLGCPWECLIDETVPTKGRSHEDVALYEIFYTNPLNCCGMIVEVGAGDGVQHSTSFFFEKGMNWTTHLIEADPLAYARIADNRSGRKAIATNGAFCQEGPYLYFDEESHTFQGLTSQDDHSSELMSKDFVVTNSTSKVDCVRLDTVLAGIDHVNVMIIRVKGDPWAVIRTMDWNVRVDIWVILMEQKDGVTHDTARAALRLHDYVPAAWDIKLWCDETPTNCMENEVWLRKNFNPIRQPLLQDHRSLRGRN